MRSFNPTSTIQERACQSWLILIGCAANRQTIRYRDMEYSMYEKRTSGGITGRSLGLIALYCQHNNLPELNVLVVNVGGTPGRGVPLLASGRTRDEEREKIYDTNWYAIVPPTAEDFAAYISELAEVEVGGGYSPSRPEPDVVRLDA